MASVDRSYQLLAARYVRKQLAALLRQIDGVRLGTDVECVHQARVASRRLRAGMKMFHKCFPGKRVKKWDKQIRTVTRGLGVARDKDVQIEQITQALAGLPDRSFRTGIGRLVLRLRQERQAAQPAVVQALDELETSGVLEDMKTTTKAALAALRNKDVTIQSPFLFVHAERLILRRVEELLTFQECLDSPHEKAKHHQMRIATKRLRYTMEICQPVYDDELAPPVAAAKRLQTLLGDLHDCDVWMDHLRVFLEEEYDRTVAYFGQAGPFKRILPGVEYLMREQQRRRDELFAELGTYWRELLADGLWDRTIALVLSRVRKAPEPVPVEDQAATTGESAPLPAEAGQEGQQAGAGVAAAGQDGDVAAAAATAAPAAAPAPASVPAAEAAPAAPADARESSPAAASLWDGQADAAGSSAAPETPANLPPVKPAEVPDGFRRPEAHLHDPQEAEAEPPDAAPGQYVATPPVRERPSPGLFQ
jgi:CHAD domain-containing protein